MKLTWLISLASNTRTVIVAPTGSKLVSDTVNYVHEEPAVQREFNNGSLVLEAPGFTPWFDAWMKVKLCENMKVKM